MNTTTTWHDANGFPHELGREVTFSLEESDEWYCTACGEDVHGDVDDKGHRVYGPTHEAIYTAAPLDGETDGDVFSGKFEDALAHFISTFMNEEEDQA